MIFCCAAGTSFARRRGSTASMDVAVRGGRIAAVEKTILPSSAAEVIDVSGKLVLPGLIDTHAHVYQYVTGRFGLNPDMVGVRSGVTTVIDQGGPSCMTLPGFRHFVVEPAKTRVYAFLSSYLVGGLEGPLLPQSLQPGRHRHRGDRDGRQRQPRHRARHQGPRRDRRLRALGHKGAADVGRDRPQAPTCRFTFISARSGACRRAAPTARTPTRSWSA